MAKAEKTKRSKRPQQLEIDGTQPERNPELEKVLGPYIDTLYERMDLQVKEEQLKAAVYARMASLKVPFYTYRSGATTYRVKLESKSTLSCKKVDEEKKPRGTRKKKSDGPEELLAA